jgi:hypothetical protein
MTKDGRYLQIRIQVFRKCNASCWFITETGSDDDALDISDDDFFMSASSSDDEADDEWTDKSTKYCFYHLFLA